ncbi:MAG: MOSC domain-containing protein [Myxococcota bacterium]
MIRVSALHVYPVKSAAGLSVEHWPVDSFGFAEDRRFMVVDAQGAFMTQRKDPHMALLSVVHMAGQLRLSYPGHPDLIVRPPASASSRPVVIWGETVSGVSVGAESAKWLSSALGTPCQLVHMAEDTERPVDPDYAERPAKVSFADGFPFLLISEASLEDLNGRLDAPVTMARFRPNIVVSGTAPFEEDTWREIRIGDVHFEIVKPCARCVMTTVEPSTGVGGKEPLRTLASYRNVDGAVLFGQNMIHRSEGTLRLDQPVEILSTT